MAENFDLSTAIPPPPPRQSAENSPSTGKSNIPATSQHLHHHHGLTPSSPSANKSKLYLSSPRLASATTSSSIAIPSTKIQNTHHTTAVRQSSPSMSSQSPILLSPLSAWGSIWSGGTRSEDDPVQSAGQASNNAPVSEPWRHSAFPVSWDDRRLSADQAMMSPAPAVNRVPPAYRQQAPSPSATALQSPASPTPPPQLLTSHTTSSLTIAHSHHTTSSTINPSGARYGGQPSQIQPTASSVRHRFAHLAEATREAEVLSHMRGMSLGSANNGSNPGSPASVSAMIPNSPVRLSAVSPGPAIFEASPLEGPTTTLGPTTVIGVSSNQVSNQKSSRSSSFSSVWDDPLNPSSAWTARSPLTPPVRANKFKFAPDDQQAPSIMSPKGTGPIQMNTTPTVQYHSPTFAPQQQQLQHQLQPPPQHQPITLNGPPPTFYPYNYAPSTNNMPIAGSPVSTIPEQGPNISIDYANAGVGTGPSSAPASASIPATTTTATTTTTAGSGDNSNGNVASGSTSKSNRRNSGNGSTSRSIPRSALLEEFRNNKTNKKYELGDLLGHAFEFSSDQHGSRFIQQKFESSTPAEMDAFFNEILPESLHLMIDVFGNYVIQKFFELGTDRQRIALATTMKGHVLSLSLQMYGCRVVQKAIEFISPEMRVQLIQELEGHVLRCVKDQNGNHVIQKAIECISSDQIEFIFRAFDNQVYDLAVHPYGCRVIQRMLEYCDETQQKELLAQLHDFTKSLVEDQYGNYVVQHVIQKGAAADRAQAIQVIRGSIVTFSRHKFASNVVEKSILCGNAQQRRDIIDEILTPRPSDGTIPISLMIKDQYANYVIQKLLDVTSGPDHDRLVTAIRPHLQSLKKYAYGKHLVSIEKLLSSTVPKK